MRMALKMDLKIIEIFECLGAVKTRSNDAQSGSENKPNMTLKKDVFFGAKVDRK